MNIFVVQIRHAYKYVKIAACFLGQKHGNIKQLSLYMYKFISKLSIGHVLVSY